MKTKVLYRRWSHSEEPFAVFPEIAAGNNGDMVTMNAYFDDRFLAIRLTPSAITRETLDNHTRPMGRGYPTARAITLELERMGYQLRPVARITAAMDEKRHMREVTR